MLYHCYRNRCTIVTENDASLLLILMYSILPKMMYFSLPITKFRGGSVIAIVNKGNMTMKEMASVCLEIPQTLECLSPIVASIPLQLLAYHIAIYKGRNVDQPRNLAKSVTVE